MPAARGRGLAIDGALESEVAPWRRARHGVGYVITDSSDPTLPWMRRLDAERDWLPAVLEDHTGRLKRAEGRLTRLAARFAAIATFDYGGRQDRPEARQTWAASHACRGHDGPRRAAQLAFRCGKLSEFVRLTQFRTPK